MQKLEMLDCSIHLESENQNDMIIQALKKNCSITVIEIGYNSINEALLTRIETELNSNREIVKRIFPALGPL